MKLKKKKYFSNMETNNTKFIAKYLKESASTNDIRRGRIIYFNDGVEYSFVEEDGQYFFDVNGSVQSYYEVSVYRPYTSEISSSCDCIQSRSTGFCKHQVAALLALKENDFANEDYDFKLSQNSYKSNYSSSLDPNRKFFIEDYLPVNDNLIERVKGKTIYEYSDFTYSFQSHSNQQLRYLVFHSHLQNLYTIVDIESKSKNIIGIQCSCKDKLEKGKLCKHASGLLEFFKNNPQINYLPYIGADGEKNLYKEMAKEEAIPIELFKQHFHCSIDRNGINIYKNAGSEGFIIGRDWNNSSITNLANKIDINLSPSSLIPKSKETGNYDVSILFDIYIWENIYVCPLIAKLNAKKNKFVSNFKACHDSLPEYFANKYSDLAGLLHMFKPQKRDPYTNAKSAIESDSYILLQKIFAESKILKYGAYYTNSSEIDNIKKGQLYDVELSNIPVEVHFKVKQDELVYTLQTFLRIGDEDILLNSSNSPDYYVNRFLIENKRTFHLFKNLKHQKILEFFKKIPEVTVAKDNYLLFEQKFIRPIMSNFEIDLSEINKAVIIDDYQRPKSKEIYLSESDGQIVFEPKITYKGDVQFNLLSESNMYLNKNKIQSIPRDINYEENYLDFIEGLHPNFPSQTKLGVYYLQLTQMTDDYWFLDAFEKMKEQGVKIFGLNELKAFKYSTHRANIKSNISSGQDWFDVDLQVSFGDYQLSLADLKKVIKKDGRFVELGDGSIGILPQKWLSKMKNIFRHSDSSQKDSLRISKLKFSQVEELFDNIDDEKIIKELAEKRSKLLSFKEISKVDVPKEINAELRPYQKEGYNWLNFLDDNGWGGILADDMGLGKTIQILTFLQSKINANKESTHLIVLPTTLVFNWEKEITKFTKNIKVLYHTGTKRAKSCKKFSEYNFVITTYGVLLNDIKFIKKHCFDYAILDESQLIKNPSSKRYKAALLINAKNKIALTGTPIENNTFDLYAQMNFVNPAFLGSQKNFKDEYSLPIDRDKDESRARDLHKLINPFILRRTKEQVATELPPKIEDVLFCEMEDEQQKVYDVYRNKYRDFLMGKMKDEGLNKSKMFVLEGLTKLRQICDSPSLLPEKEQYSDESIKIKTLINHIEEKTNKHKILVFSQFVKMLALVKDKLESKGISYEYLDGKCNVKQREASVDNFQNNDEVKVFLISLKAGGTGLNLTAADYVYLLDPWWNPAVENQAIDRAYRIGQDKKVIAYRMICKNTIEEKIKNIQSKKKKLASDIIQTDESVLKVLTQADVLDLFA
jgi:SNF2 family DNA or RNA helicase